MDGDVGEPSNEKVYLYASELFWDALPTYLAVGMSAEEFWNGEPKLAKAYREAEKIKRENRYLAEWRAGAYVFEALCAASPAFRELSKGIEHEYPSSPIFSTTSQKVLTEEEKNKAQMDKNKAAFLVMAEKFNAKLAEKRAMGQGDL